MAKLIFEHSGEEVQLADVIMHIRDVAHPEARAQKDAVESILNDLGIAPNDERLIEVLNKSDLLPEDEQENLRIYAGRASWDAQHALDVQGVNPPARGGIVAISATTGFGIDDLIHLLDEKLSARSTIYEIDLPLEDGAALAWLYQHGKVLDRHDKKTRTTLRITLDAADFGRFQSRFQKDSHAKG